MGATPPDPNSADPVVAAMGAHLDVGGKLKCSTCHDVHGDAAPSAGTVHVSPGLATTITVTTGSGGTLKVSSAPAGAKAAGYVIKVATFTAPNGTFQISHDNGRTFGTATAFSNNGTAAKLDDNVATITITGTPSVGQTWQSFSVSYPFLRADGARMCVSCHKDRDMRWGNVEGTGTIPGTNTAVSLTNTVFSHPVGNALGVNGGGYDRSSTTILDANGVVQSTGGGDGNIVNDLVLDPSGNVNCLTCHHPHNSPSNSLSTHTW
jgi:hypothetical protein